MKIYALKFTIFTLSIILSSIVFIIIGQEIIVQIAKLILGVAEEENIPKDSGVAMVTVYGLIPEVVFGSICGWYLADWICKKIWNY